MHHLSVSKNERSPVIENAFLFSCKCKVNQTIVRTLYSVLKQKILQACLENWVLLPQLESRLTQAEMGKLGTLLSKYQVGGLFHIYGAL